MDWFKFYVGDYARDTGDLSPLEHGLYLRLMLHYYSTEKPLPDDDAKLLRIAGVGSREKRKIATIRGLLARFFCNQSGYWAHARIDKEILKYQERAATNRKNVVDGRYTNRAPDPEARYQIPEQRPKTLAQGKPARASAKKVNGAEFDAFWNAYPKKRNKADAVKAWSALNPDEPLYRRIMASVEAHKSAPDWRKDGGQYVPYPASWLRAEGWEDVIDKHSEPDIFAGCINIGEFRHDDRDNSAPARVRRAQQAREERERSQSGIIDIDP